jgi:outer membrane protein OmpA-like peptidoglycan-associated protein
LQQFVRSGYKCFAQLTISINFLTKLIKMKKRTFLLLLFVGTLGIAQAQKDRPYDHQVAYRLIFNDFFSPNSNTSPRLENLPRGVEVSYARPLIDGVNLQIPVRLGATSGKGDLKSALSFGLDALLVVEHFRSKNAIVPYFGLGPSVQYTANKADFGLPAVAGLNFRVWEGGYVNIQSAYRSSISENRGQWQHGVGLVIPLGLKDGDDKKLAAPPRYIEPAKPQIDPAAEAAKIKMEAEARAKAEAQTRMEAEARAKAEMEAKAAAEMQAKADAQAKIEAEARAKAEMEARAKADMQAKAEAEAAAKRDTDGDGISDASDRCPTVSGSTSNNGCPVEVSAETKRILETAVKNVQFETGKSVLLVASKAVLDQIVAIMVQNPSYRLNISGHTDNMGNEASNVKLSEARAKACGAYLISKGVSAALISTMGYGSKQPKADNSTKQGRDENRRVEFQIQ